MKSSEYRSSSKLLRNSFPVTDIHQMPILKKNDLPYFDDYLPYRDTKNNDIRSERRSILVHCFQDDYRFESIYNSGTDENAQQIVRQLAQYAAVCTPDYSLYPQMPLPIQQEQIFKSRWCGAYWESVGLCVIPTVTWGDEESFSFCFEGVPQNSTVAVSTVGCEGFKREFMRGYNEMLCQLNPQYILCYGVPFSEMNGDIISFPHESFYKEDI